MTVSLSSSSIAQSIFKSHHFFHGRRRIRTRLCRNGTPTPNRHTGASISSFILVPYYIIIRNITPFTQYRNHTRLSPMSSLADDHHSSTTTKTVRVLVKGRVQGVFYRNWTIENAKELGLRGWVRNRRDGSVEALFSGSSDKVQEMEQRCRRGPPAAMVTGLEVSPCNDDPGIGFERKQTI